MRYIRDIGFFFFFLLNITYISGQFNANSIYSRFGIGDIDRSGFSQNRGLGGIAIGMRQQNHINFLNPASYNSQDTLSFLWDIGLFGAFTNSSTSEGSSRRNSFNFDHLAISFPVTFSYYISAGISPYSHMGYNVKQTSIEPSTLNQTLILYKGSGNLNQLYFGHSIGFLKKKVNLGVNLSYIFGSLNINDVIEFYDLISGLYTLSNSKVSSYIEKRYFAQGIGFSTGLQGSLNVKNNVVLVYGATYDPQTRIKMNYTTTISRTSVNLPIDTILNSDTSSNFLIPGRVGLGFSLEFNKKLLVGLDFTLQDWSKSTFPDFSEPLNASHRFSFGIQYTPERQSFRNYFSKVNYRLGGYFNDTYLNLNGHYINEYGLTFGFGLPFKNTGSVFNISFEIGSRGTKEDNLMKIDFGRITLGLSLFDKWFMKKKYY